METPCKDKDPNLALQAMQNDSSLSIRRAAQLYNVSRVTLGRRLKGTTPRRDSPPNSAKLTELEEKVIALCEDPAAINAWFTLMQNTIAKYGIADDDIYNFNETGFQIGVISAGMVVTSSERVSNAKLMQPGNREWAIVIQGVGGTGFYVPPLIVVSG